MREAMLTIKKSLFREGVPKIVPLVLVTYRFLICWLGACYLTWFVLEDTISTCTTWLLKPARILSARHSQPKIRGEWSEGAYCNRTKS